MRLNHYFAVFQTSSNKETRTLQVCDSYSHPFIWMHIQKELYSREWVCLFWKVITEEEFEYYSDTINGRF